MNIPVFANDANCRRKSYSEHRFYECLGKSIVRRPQSMSWISCRILTPPSSPWFSHRARGFSSFFTILLQLTLAVVKKEKEKKTARSRRDDKEKYTRHVNTIAHQTRKPKHWIAASWPYANSLTVSFVSWPTESVVLVCTRVWDKKHYSPETERYR